MENPSESIFINRELSWLDFDSRVLALAKEKSVPLAERIKFAAIFGSVFLMRQATAMCHWQKGSPLRLFIRQISMSFLWCVLARCMTRRC